MAKSHFDRDAFYCYRNRCQWQAHQKKHGEHTQTQHDPDVGTITFLCTTYLDGSLDVEVCMRDITFRCESWRAVETLLEQCGVIWYG